MMRYCDEDEDGEDGEDGDHVDVKAAPTTKVVVGILWASESFFPGVDYY